MDFRVSYLSVNTPQGTCEKTLTSPPSGPLSPELGPLRPAATLIFQARISRAEKQSPCWQTDGTAPWLWGRQKELWMELKGRNAEEAEEIEMCPTGLPLRDPMAPSLTR